MSSKVLTGEAARPAQRMVWGHPAPGAIPEAETSGQFSAAQAEECESLRHRIAELQREMERREQAATRSGMEKGRIAGEQEAAARLNSVIERFAATINELAMRRRQWRHDAEADVVKLSIAIARRVLRRELNADPDAMLGLVKAALDKVDSREVQRVRVHPTDAPAVKAYLERLRPDGQFEVAPDSRLNRGAAVFETVRGSLDGSVETQLAEIERGLIERLGS